MIKMLSFDQAANVSGWSYWEDKTPRAWGVITPKPKSAKGGRRLCSLREQFAELIDRYNPDIVLIEDPVGNEVDDECPEANWKTMQVLCQVQGVLIQLIEEKHKEIDIISPSSWQFTCNIHARDRGSRKIGARNFVEHRYGLITEQVPQDVCDSFCIAFHHLEGGVYEEGECAF